VNLCQIPVVINPNNQDCYRPLDQYFPDPAHANDPSFTIDPYGSVDYKSDTGQSTYHALFLSLEGGSQMVCPFRVTTLFLTPSMTERLVVEKRMDRKT